MDQTWELLAGGTMVIVLALVAGVFLTFSDFVMKSLGLAKPAAGMEAMQYINRKVYGSFFMVLLMGGSIASAALAVYAYFEMTGDAAIWFVAGGASYFLGVFVLTLLANVPMNKRLDKMDAETESGQTYWLKYLSVWTAWNHMRTGSSAASAICFLVGSVLLAQGAV